MLSVESLKAHLVNHGNICRGCSEIEIVELSNFYSIRFPSLYMKFLGAMGKSAGRFMLGSSVFYKDSFNLGLWGKELVIENNLPALSANMFVFWMHQGYQLAFFNSDLGNDSPIYFYSEGMKENEYKVVSPNLMEFLLAQLGPSGITPIEQAK